MKICILTQPLHTNYGGLLQAYALQKVVQSMGHEVWTEDRKANRYSPLRKLARTKFLRTIMGQPRYLTAAEKAIIQKYTNQFIEKYITTTVAIDSCDKRLLKPYCFEGYIVGSDQVWRREYSPGIENYFLDFATDESRKVAYAASFGTEQWSYSPAMSLKIKKLAQRFDCITVRESDAVALCKEHLDVDAMQVVDPTMLLSADDYRKLAADTMQYESKAPNGGVVQYLLDPTEEKKWCAEYIATALNLSLSDIGHSGANTFDGRNANKRVIAPPTFWLTALSQAQYIVTDSFHGVLLAVLFNVPFIALSNPQRGASRFRSLLEPLGLQDRLVLPTKRVPKTIIHNAIDFAHINKLIEERREECLAILRDALA